MKLPEFTQGLARVVAAKLPAGGWLVQVIGHQDTHLVRDDVFRERFKAANAAALSQFWRPPVLGAHYPN